MKGGEFAACPWGFQPARPRGKGTTLRPWEGRIFSISKGKRTPEFFSLPLGPYEAIIKYEEWETVPKGALDIFEKGRRRIPVFKKGCEGKFFWTVKNFYSYPFALFSFFSRGPSTTISMGSNTRLVPSVIRSPSTRNTAGLRDCPSTLWSYLRSALCRMTLSFGRYSFLSSASVAYLPYFLLLPDFSPAVGRLRTPGKPLA
jgi:hypothetical protein